MLSTTTAVVCLLATAIGSSARAAADAPAADTGATTPTAQEVHGQVACGPQVATATAEVFKPRIVEISDPRLDGEFTLGRATAEYPVEGVRIEETPSAEAITWQIVNDAGAWEGSYLTFGVGGQGPEAEIITLAGDGAYEGMHAVIESTWFAEDATDCGWYVRGMILDGDFPAFPELPSDG